MRRNTILASSKDLTATLVLHDRNTDQALSSLVCRSGNAEYDSLSVIYNGRSLISSGDIDTLSVTETKPSQGSGLIKRNLAVSIVSSSPFTVATWTRKLYSAGLNSDAFYFSLWVSKASELNKDLLKVGLCMGKFVIDSALDWAEADTTLNFNLIDISQTFDKKLNYYPQVAVDKLQGTEWEALLNSSLYVGTFSKVPLVRSANATTAIVGAVDPTATLSAGVVTYYTSSYIGLGNTTFLAANVGTTAKVLLGTGELVSGVIQLDSGTYRLSITTRNVAWATVNISASLAASPVDSTLIINQCRLDSLANLLSVGMYVKVPTLHFYNTVTPGDIIVNNKIVQLQSVIDSTNRIVSHGDILDAASTVRTLFGIEYTAGTTNSAFPSDTQFNHAVAQSLAGANSELYFRDITTAAANPGVGTSWVIYKTGANNSAVTTDTAATFNFVRSVGSTVTAVYAKAGSTYYPLSAAQYSLTYSQTFQGVDNLTKVTVTGKWPQIVPNGTDGSYPLYVDLLNSVHVDALIQNILSGLAPEYWGYFGATFQFPVTAAPGMLCNAIITTDDTLTSVLDSLLFETGCVLRWAAIQTDRNYRLELEDLLYSNIRAAYWPDTTDAGYAFCRPITTKHIDNSEILDGSLRIGVGKLDTNYSAATATEWVSAWLKVSTPLSIGDSASYQLRTNRSRERKDRYIDYTLRHAIDASGATKTATDILSAPHAMAALQTTRTVNLLLSIDRLDLEASDMIDLRNVPFLTDTVDAPIYKDGSGLIYYRFNNQSKYILLPNLFQIESININFSIGSYGIALNLKQAQFGWYNNVTGSAKYNIGVPDVAALPPPLDSGNPITLANPAVPPPNTQCSGTPTQPTSPITAPLGSTQASACSGPASCDTPANPGEEPTSPNYGEPCPENPKFGSANCDIHFDQVEYLKDTPSDVAIKLLMDAGGVESLTGGYPQYFQAGTSFAPGGVGSIVGVCASLSGPSGGNGVGVLIGSGSVGACAWVNISTLGLPVALNAEVIYGYQYGEAEIKDQTFAISHVWLKPLMEIGSVGIV